MDTSIPLDTSQSKQCRLCGQTFPLTFFNKNGKKLRNECKACTRARFNLWHHEHKEERREYNAEWQQQHQEERLKYHARRNQELREYQRAFAKQYYHEHKEERREYNAEYNRSEQGKKTRKAYEQSEHGRAARKAINHKRRAGSHYRRNSFTAQQFLGQLKRQQYRCYYCHEKHTEKNFVWHADHIVPLSRGGSNDISNIVAACPTCNLKKANKLLHEWDEGGRLL